MSKEYKHLLIQLAQGTFSLIAAYFCFKLLNSTAEGTWGGWKFGGGLAGFFSTWYLFNRFWGEAVKNGNSLKGEKKSPIVRVSSDQFPSIQTQDTNYSYDVQMRKDHWNEIFEKISDAKRTVTFIGGTSSTLLLPENLTKFAKSLEKNSDLKIKFIYESDDNLFRRSQYLTQNIEAEDFRDFKDLVKRKEDIICLPNTIAKHAKTKLASSVRERVIVKEMHMQLYLIVTLIDDTFYMTPMLHRRSSRSISIRVDNTNDPLYKLLDEYIKYIENPKLGEPYLTDPNEEILQIFDMSGFPRGYCARSTLDKVNQIRHKEGKTTENLMAKVVFGFVFNGEGKLLLQKRGKTASDNIGLWDKSFGGHMKGFQDISIIDTAKRELVEELFCKNISEHQCHYLGPWNKSFFNSKHEPYIKNCSLFLINKNCSYRSERITNTGERKDLWFNVTTFAVFCINSASLAAMSNDVEEIKWIDISKLPEEIKTNQNQYTFDLKNIVLSPDYDVIKEISLYFNQGLFRKE